MKKVISLIMIFGLCFIIVGCKKKENFKTKEEIKETYKYFQINADIDGSVYQITKSSTGVLMANNNLNVYYYYNSLDNRSYSLNLVNEQKILLEGNGIVNNYIDNIYYVLTIHLEKDFSKYEKTNDTYLDRDIVIYSFESGNVKEEYYIDSQTDGCLYFYINDGVKSITCKFDSIKLDDVDLGMYNNYTTLTSVNKMNLKSKEKILSSLETFAITYKVNDVTITVIKDNLGLYYYYEGFDSLLYINEDQKWYLLNESNKTKSEYVFESTKEDILNNLYSFLIGYIDNINESFYEKAGNTHLGIDVITYQRINQNEIYYVDQNTGICLKSYIKATKTLEYETTSFNTNATVLEYVEYQTVAGSKVYQSLPTNHKYLQQISGISHGEFKIAIEDEDGLTIFYNNISENNFNNIKKAFVDAGYNLSQETDKQYNGSYYIYYTFTSTSSDGYKLTLNYYGEDFTLIINITE